MHLVVATNSFQIAGQPKPGFPILLWGNLQSCCEANEFLRYYLMRGAIGSKKSWGVVGRALYDYFGFLQAHELTWTDVDRGENKNLVAAYRDYCFEVDNLKRNTVRQRLLYICEFYAFAKRRGWLQTLPYQLEERHAINSGTYLTHRITSEKSRDVRSVMPRKHRDLPKFHTKDQAKALLGATQNPHHRILIRLALQTGLRRQELATFPLAYVFDPDIGRGREKNVRLTLDPNDGTGMKTKGNKKRVIYFSRKLMKDLSHYASHWRGERASLSSRAQTPLFLNQAGQPWRDDGKGIEAIVRRAGAKVGIKTHPHMLRHTYATHTLSALQRSRSDTRIEPLVFIQRQLGHSSINTTMVYLHLVNEIADEAVLAYDEEINSWMAN